MDTLIPPKHALNLTTFWTWMGEDGICRTKTKPDAEIGLNEAIENSNAVTNFYTDRKFPLLIDSRDIRCLARKARVYLTTRGRDTKISSMAIMVKSPLSRVIGNFFMGINKPQVPARLFDNETEAINWLKNFLK